MAFLSRTGLTATRQVLRAAPVRALSGGNEAAIPTALADWHASKSGKMVPFAGYSLPVREKATVFCAEAVNQGRI
jgi:hypothetical protein